MKWIIGGLAGLVVGTISSFLFVRARPDVVQSPRLVENAVDLKLFEIPPFTFPGDRSYAIEARTRAAPIASTGLMDIDPRDFAASQGRYDAAWEDLGTRILWPTSTTSRRADEGLRLRVQPLDPIQLDKFFGGKDDVHLLLHLRFARKDWTGEKEGTLTGSPFSVKVPGTRVHRYVVAAEDPTDVEGRFVRLDTLMTFSEVTFYATELRLITR